MGLLTGKTALVFGLANDRSIAWGITQALRREGATLGFGYHPMVEKYARPLVESLGVSFFEPCDVASDLEIQAVAAKAQAAFGGVDILIHSIGYANREELSGAYYQTSRAGFHLAMDISVYSFTCGLRCDRLSIYVPPIRPPGTLTASGDDRGCGQYGGVPVLRPGCQDDRAGHLRRFGLQYHGLT
jgi:enoyl-[acyl-carrier-protein] reductase (NADH)